MNDNEDEREDTLTNIRAVRTGVTSLSRAVEKDRTKAGRLTKLAFGVVLVIFAAGMTAATHMSQGISDIREDQRLVQGDISKILTVTTNLANEAQQAHALERRVILPTVPAPLPPPPEALGTQAPTAP